MCRVLFRYALHKLKNWANCVRSLLRMAFRAFVIKDSVQGHKPGICSDVLIGAYGSERNIKSYFALVYFSETLSWIVVTSGVDLAWNLCNCVLQKLALHIFDMHEYLDHPKLLLAWLGFKYQMGCI